MIFIPGNVPSVKNSKNPFLMGKGKNQRIVLTPSKTVKNYLQFIGVKKYRVNLSKKQVEKGVQKIEEYVRSPNLFKESVGDYFKNDIAKPLILGFHFMRSSKRKFDFHNAAQIISDLLVAHEFIDDDNMDCLIPMPFKLDGWWYHITKDNPGVLLKIIEEKDLKGIIL